MNELSISRGDDLTPEQPTPKEQIQQANEYLKAYGDKLYREEVPMWVVNLLKDIFTREEKNFMDEVVADFLKAVMEGTNVDEKLYASAAEFTKERIPGDKYEPIIGEVLEGVGKELQKPSE